MICPEHSVVCEIESKLRDVIDLLDRSLYCEAACLVGECLQLLLKIEEKNEQDFSKNEEQEAEKNC